MSPPATGHSAAYIAELKKRLNSHRKWVVGTRGGMQADLSFYDMSQLPLGGVVLRNAKLVGTSFARSNLSRADLKAAVLMMAELEGRISARPTCSALICAAPASTGPTWRRRTSPGPTCAPGRSARSAPSSGPTPEPRSTGAPS